MIFLKVYEKWFHSQQNNICYLSEKQTARKITKFKNHYKNTEAACKGKDQSGTTKREGFGANGKISILRHIF